MQAGQLNEFLKSRGIDRGSLVNQLTASIVWGKLVRRQAAQNTEISEEEVDDALKRVVEHAGEPQSPRVAEIFLAVDNPTQDEEVRTSLPEKADRSDEEGRAVLGNRPAILAIGDRLGGRRHRLGAGRPDAGRFGQGGPGAQAGRRARRRRFGPPAATT